MKTVIGILSLLIWNTGNAGTTMSESGKAVAQLTITIGGTVAACTVFSDVCAETPYGTWACPLAIMSASQAVNLIGTRSDAKNTYTASRCLGGNCTGDIYNPNDPSNGVGPQSPDPIGDTLVDEYQRQVNATRTQLERQGYKLNPDGSVKMPNGKTVKPGDFASPGAMAGAGFSQGEIARANEVLPQANSATKNKMADLAKMLANQMANAGGSMTIRNKKYVGGDEFDPNKFLKGLGRGPASAGGVAGLSKNVGQDSIGVSGDNIFKMINRQYDNQRSKGSFLFK